MRKFRKTTFNFSAIYKISPSNFTHFNKMLFSAVVEDFA